MNKELPKVYEPQQVEERIYAMWEQGGCFNGDPDPAKKPFSIVMPPPNVTGQLHMGHAMDCTLQDILTRFKRMQGYSTLWVRGTDHAGIATQIKVEEELRTKEGLTRYDPVSYTHLDVYKRQATRSYSSASSWKRKNSSTSSRRSPVSPWSRWS